MGHAGAVRIQLCGRLVVRLAGGRVEDALPGADGRLLFAYLVLNRLRCVAFHVASRPLLQGHDRVWLDEWRRRLDEVRLRGLECFAAARLGLGGPTLPQAEDCGRRLVELAPYRESGYQILIEALERRSNNAE